MTKHPHPPEPPRLWVFAQYPVKKEHVLIPVEAANREDAIRIVETDPQRIGKPLTPKVFAGRPGFTDGVRDFILFEDPESLLRFLHEQSINPG